MSITLSGSRQLPCPVVVILVGYFIYHLLFLVRVVYGSYLPGNQ